MERIRFEKKFIKSFKYKHKQFATSELTCKKRHPRKEPLISIEENSIATSRCDQSTGLKVTLKLSNNKSRCHLFLLLHLLSTILLLLIHQVPTRLAFCPSKCICNDQSLSANCTQVPSLSVIPITLNPLLKQLTLNQLPIVELANSLSVYRQLEYLNLASNQIRQINYENFNFKPAPHSVNFFPVHNNQPHTILAQHQFANDKSQQQEWNSKQENLARILKSSIDRSLTGGSSFANQVDEIGFHLRELDLQDNKIDQLGGFLETTDFELSGDNQEQSGDSKRKTSLKASDLERQAPFLMLTKLERLNLSGNKIVQLNQHVFLGLLHLKQLDISRNQLEYISQHSLVGLIELKVLNLSHNKLTSHLNKLRLTFCGAPLNEMRHLDLSDNDRAGLATPAINVDQQQADVLLPNQMFICSPKLVSLRLDGLKLRHIQVNALDNVQQLETLDLSRNYLEHVPTDPLSNPRSNVTSSLRQLDLSDNLIEFVNAHSFGSLANLQKLSMNSMRHLVSFDLASLSFWIAERETPVIDGNNYNGDDDKVNKQEHSENIEQLMRKDDGFRQAIKSLLPGHLFQRTIGGNKLEAGEAGGESNSAGGMLNSPPPPPRKQLINDQLIELQMRDCKRLQSMHSSLADQLVSFTKLKLIDLNGASELRELPLDRMINFSQSASKLSLDLSFAGQLNCSSCQMSWLIEAAKREQREQNPLLGQLAALPGSSWFQVKPELGEERSNLEGRGHDRIALIGSDLIGCSWPIAMPLAHLAASLMSTDNSRQLAAHLCNHRHPHYHNHHHHQQQQKQQIITAPLDELNQRKLQAISQFGGDTLSIGSVQRDIYNSNSNNNNKSLSVPNEREAAEQSTADLGSLVLALLAALVLIGLIGRLLVTLINHNSNGAFGEQFKWSRSASISLATPSSQLNSPATSSSSASQNNKTSASTMLATTNNDCSSGSAVSSLVANGAMCSTGVARQWNSNGVCEQQPSLPVEGHYVQFGATSGQPHRQQQANNRSGNRLYCNPRLIGVDELIFSGLANGQIEPCSNSNSNNSNNNHHHYDYSQTQLERRLAGNLFSRIKAHCSGGSSRLVCTVATVATAATGKPHSRRGLPAASGGLRAWLANLGGSRQLADSALSSSQPASSSYRPASVENEQQQQAWRFQQLPMLPVVADGHTSTKPAVESSAGGRRALLMENPHLQLMKEPGESSKLYENHLYHVVGPQFQEEEEAAAEAVQVSNWKELRNELIIEPSTGVNNCLRQRQQQQQQLAERELQQLRAKRNMDTFGAQNFARSDQVNTANDSQHLRAGPLDQDASEGQRGSWEAADKTGSSAASEEFGRQAGGESGTQVHLYGRGRPLQPQFNGHKRQEHLKPDEEGRLELASSAGGCRGGGSGGFTADRHIYVTLDRPIKQEVVGKGHYYESGANPAAAGAPSKRTLEPSRQKQQLELAKGQWNDEPRRLKGGFSDNLGHSISPDDYKSFEWSNSAKRQQQQQQQQQLNGPLETDGSRFKAAIQLKQQQQQHEEAQSVSLFPSIAERRQPPDEEQEEAPAGQNNRLLSQNGNSSNNHLQKVEQQPHSYDSQASSDFAVKRRKSGLQNGRHNGNVTGHSDYDDGRLKARSQSVVVAAAAAAAAEQQQQQQTGSFRQQLLLASSQLNGDPTSSDELDERRLNEGRSQAADVKLNGPFKQPTVRPSLTEAATAVAAATAARVQPRASPFNLEQPVVGKYDANHDVVVVVANRPNQSRNANEESVVSTGMTTANTPPTTTFGASCRQLVAATATANNNDNNTNHNHIHNHNNNKALYRQSGDAWHNNNALHYDDYVINGSGYEEEASALNKALHLPARNRLPFPVGPANEATSLAEPADEWRCKPALLGVPNSSQSNGIRHDDHHNHHQYDDRSLENEPEAVVAAYAGSDANRSIGQQDDNNQVERPPLQPNIISRQGANGGGGGGGGATWKRSCKQAANEIYSNQFYYCKPSKVADCNSSKTGK